MIRNSSDLDTEIVHPRTPEQWLQATEEMIRIAESLCKDDPDSFGYQLQLESLKAHRASLLEELGGSRLPKG